GHAAQAGGAGLTPPGAMTGPEVAPREPVAVAVDGLEPETIEQPTSPEAVKEILAEARSERLGIVVVGGGTALAIGNVPRRYDLAVDMRALRAIGDYSAADLVVTAQAGVTVGQLQSLLQPNGQFLPLDAPPDATLGGVVAAGQAGRRRYSRGTPRDWVIGARAILGNGRSIRAGAAVVKNVAGYDVLKLLCGSAGTLGVLTEVTFKVAPIPQATTTWTVACDSWLGADAVRQAVAAWNPAWIELGHRSGAAIAIEVGFEGATETVEWQSQQFQRGFPTARLASPPSSESRAAALELVVGTLPDRLAGVLQACTVGAVTDVTAHFGNGIARLAAAEADPEILQRWQDAIVQSGGWWRLDRGPKADRECFGPPRPEWS
ncbi:MAG: FAD-binding oxidoreductase, partial [Cyanobacteria bacterium REEB65]|nr:FAD-binding oxidoreductase [Cyanobacteria bacterium REEB65]